MLTWALTMRQPSASRTQVWVWKPRSAVSLRTNSTWATTWSGPKACRRRCSSRRVKLGAGVAWR